MSDHVARGPGGEQVLVECFAGQRAGYRAIRADKPEVEPELLRDRQGELVTASGDQHHLDPGPVHPLEGAKVGAGDLELRIDESAINIDRQQSDCPVHR